MYENYEKNNKKSWVRSDLKGKQKEFCMCWDCKKFNPEAEDKGCSIIKTVLSLASEKNIVLPVWECGQFEQK
jgi:hypothetical protein